MRRLLPPLNAVKAFEASARLGGFAAAAGELGVSAAAVSLQVKKLEAHFAAPLFARLARGVELTEVGTAVYRDCQNAFALLESTTSVVESRMLRSRVVLSCMPSLAQRWLAGALGGAPLVELRSEEDPVDLDHGTVDLRITYGTHLYPDHVCDVLFTDRLVPLCTPAWWASSGVVRDDPASLDDRQLIHSWWAPSFSAYPGWTEWFAAAGAPRIPRGGCSPCVNMPALAVDVALAGVGIALAQASLARREVAEGRLIAPFGVTIPLPDPYAVVATRAARRREGVVEVLRWLKGATSSL